ncbi:MAG: tetratricopeptide (TPR) repeat protein [Glaciecola sp.]
MVLFCFLSIEYNDLVDDDTAIVNEMKTHYAKASETLGYENTPDESMLNQMGYRLLEMEKVDFAGEFFKINVAYYPECFNVYDYLGGFYLASKNKDKAIESFEKSTSYKRKPRF